MSERIRDFLTEPMAFKMTTLPGQQTVRLAPDGETKSRNGRFIIDAEASAAIVADFAAHKTPIVIDFEHQTLGGEYASPDGKAPAAGWVRKLWHEAGRGLLGLVEWNDKAREMIRAGEYRFLSPVLVVDKASRRATALHSAALTNKPAIPGMERLAASENSPKEPAPDAERTDAGKDAAAPALVPNKDTEIAVAVRTQLGLDQDADAATVLAAMVDRSRVEILAAKERELTALRTKIEDAEFTIAIAPFEKLNLANPRDAADRKVLRKLFAEDRESFEAVLTARRPLIPAGQTQGPAHLSARGALLAEARAKFSTDRSLKGITSLRAFSAQLLRDRGEAELSKDEVDSLDAQEREIVAAANRKPVEQFVGR